MMPVTEERYSPRALRNGFVIAAALHVAVFVPLRVVQPAGPHALQGFAVPRTELRMVQISPGPPGAGGSDRSEDRAAAWMLPDPPAAPARPVPIETPAQATAPEPLIADADVLSET